MTHDSQMRVQTRSGTFAVALDGPEDAPVLIFSNSLGTALDMWDAQARHFAGRYRVLRYDTRGHGGSVVSTGPYSFDQLGTDVIAIMDALAIERALFCGISMGGHTGLWLAAHAAERMRGVAVCNSAARIGTAQAWHARAHAVRSGGAQAMRELADSAPQRWFTPAFIREQTDVVRQAQDALAAIDPEGYAACCEALAESDLQDALATVGLPMLLVAGLHDPVTTVADAQAMQHALPGSVRVELPASHLSSIEAPGAFNRALDAWLASVVA